MFAMWLNSMFETILSLKINMINVELETKCFLTINHVKQIKIGLVFLRSTLTFCIFVLYSNSIQLQCDNNSSGLSQNIYSCTPLNNSIANNEIRSLNPFNYNILNLLHTYLLNTVLVITIWSENWSICHSGSPYPTMATKWMNAWYFGAHPWPKSWLFEMWLNSMFEMILSLKTKYYKCRTWNKMFFNN